MRRIAVHTVAAVWVATTATASTWTASAGRPATAPAPATGAASPNVRARETAWQWLAPVEVATGRGERGRWRQNESRYDHVDDGTVLLDDDGDALVAWVDQSRKDVRLQRFARDGTARFAGAVDVSRSPATFSWLPRLALAPDRPREVHVLWQEIIFSGGSHGGDMLYARSVDGGAGFAPPVNLSKSTGGDGKGRITRDVWHNGSFDIAVGARGVVLAAWTEYDGALWLTQSADGGETFAAPRRIAGDDARPARGPSLAWGPDGTVYLAWAVGEDPGADVRVARSADGGRTFASAQRVAPGPGYSDAPKIALDSTGVLHLVCGESRAGPFEPPRVRYTRSRDGGQTFERPRELPLPHGTIAAGFPQVTVVGSTVHVAWESWPGVAERPRGLGLATSPDGGSTFGAPIVVPASVDPAGGTNGSHQGLLLEKLAARPGELAVVNSSLLLGLSSRVWLMRARQDARDATARRVAPLTRAQ